MSDQGIAERARRAASVAVDRLRRPVERLARRLARRGGRLLERMPRPVRATVEVGREILKDSGSDRVPRLAAEIGFFALLALPPALLAVLGSIGYIFDAIGQDVTRDVRDHVIGVAGTFLTTSTVDQIVAPTVRSVLEEGRAGVIWLGIALALWSTSRATAVVVEVVRIAAEVQPRRADWRRRLAAVGYTTALVLALVLLIPLLVVGPRIAELLAAPFGLQDTAVTVWRILYWPLVAAVGVLILATSYHVVLGRAHPWAGQLPGAALALATWVVGGIVLRVYGTWSIESRSIFGPLSAPVILMLWLYVSGIAVLIGAELNGVLLRRRKGRTTRSDP